MASDWIEVACALCGSRDGASVLALPHAEAPGGISHIVKCRECGLRRLNPRPGPTVIGGYYARAGGDNYNAYAGRSRNPRKQAIWNFLRDGYTRPARQSWLGRALSPFTAMFAARQFDINVRLDGRTGLRVLEVGSGYGDLLIYLKSRGCEVLGTDLSREAAAYGARNGVEIRLGNLTELRLPAAGFDLAVMCHSLEHVPDPNEELAELARLLRPNGRLHIAVPNGNAVRLTITDPVWPHLSHPLHFWFYDARTLTALLDRHGFDIAEPMKTTSWHRICNDWLYYDRRKNPFKALRDLAHNLSEAAQQADGGDVLRAVAIRRP